MYVYIEHVFYRSWGWFLLYVRPWRIQSCISAERQRASSTPVRLKSLFTVAKATAPLVRISDYRPQTKGETTSPRFCSLVCSYCPVCKKIKIQSLRYIHHLTFLARVWKREVSLRGSWRILLVFCLQRLEETSRETSIDFFFFLFWLFLNFCTESQQGVLPVGAVSIVPLKMERVKTDCFSGSGGEEQAQKVYSNFSLTLPWDVFRTSLLCLSGVWSVFDKGLASVCLLTQT